MYIYGVFILFAVLIVQRPLVQASLQSNDNSTLRLPETLNPLHYLIDLKPHLEDTFQIEGYVEVTFEAVKTTDEIVMHMKSIVTHNDSLQIMSATDSSLSVKARNQTYDVRREFYQVHLEEQLKKGHLYILKLNFSGVLSDDLEGFYKTSYFNSEGHEVWVAATHFQPSSARRAFPCFDEPQLKATFQIFLGRRKNMTALSNMPRKDSQPLEAGWVKDEFETTVPLSTYLVAFVICDFHNIEAHSDQLQTKIKLWARETHVKQATFGREISEEGLLFLERFFNLSFPLPKLDLVAVPEMSPNAMENWGLIIFRESALLHSLQKGSDEQMKWVAYLVCHELAHQWFGNIVTMKWWNDLWLNEGFATYIGYSVVDHIKPEWGILDLFVVNFLQGVMKLDALKSAPSVRTPVEDPQQIREIFGPITYYKGASLIRMMQDFLGKNTFRVGLKTYLNELKYKSSEQDDLWNYLTKTAHDHAALPLDVTVKDIMDSWTLQPGFPVILVSRTKTSVTLKQVPFYLIQSEAGDERERKWYVPITWVTQKQPEFENSVSQVWFRKDNEELIIHDIVSSDEWILFNPKQTGYYRVSYDNMTWHQLFLQLHTNHSGINLISRAQLLDDALNLAQAGLLDYNTAMSATSYLKHEKEYVPWLAFLNNFTYLDLMLRTTSVYGAFKSYMLSVLAPMYEALASEGKKLDSVTERALQKEIVTWACYLGHEDCVQKAVRGVNAWRQNPSKPSPVQRNLANSLYCAAVREGGEDVWNFIWNRYQNRSEDPGHRQILSSSLACSKEVWILARYLKAAFKPEQGITRQDASSVYETIAQTSLGSLLAWNHMKEHWIMIKNYVETSMFALPKLVKAVTSHFNTVQHRYEMTWFMERYEGEFGPAKWSVHQALESGEANVKWLSSNLNTIESWLREKGFESALRRHTDKIKQPLKARPPVEVTARTPGDISEDRSFPWTNSSFLELISN